MISNVPIKELPETKRVVYQLIKNEIVKDSEFQKGIFTVFGPKRVGKTVLMQQLCKEFDGCYFSMRQIRNEFRRERKLEFHKILISELLKCNKSLICIDDIIMTPKQYKDEFFAALREAKDKTIIVSGNVKCFVDNCTEELGSLKTFTVSGLSFYEYCNWGIDKFDSSYGFFKFKREEEVRSPELYMQATLRDIKNCYDYSKFSEDESWIVSYHLMDEWKFGQKLRLLYDCHKFFHESTEDLVHLEKFLVQIGLLSVHDGYKHAIGVSEGASLDKKHCYMNLTLLGFDDVGKLSYLEEVYCCNEALKYFDTSNENSKILIEFKDFLYASGFYFCNSKVIIKVTHDDNTKHCISLAKKLKIDNLLMTVTTVSNEGCETIKGVEVMKVSFSQLAYALGELETIPNIRELTDETILSLIKDFITNKQNN